MEDENIVIPELGRVALPAPGGAAQDSSPRSIPQPDITGKTVLVTGATGSLGQAVVGRLMSGRLGVPNKIIAFSRDEAKQHSMRLSYLRASVATDEIIYKNFAHILEFRIGDVRDYGDVARAVKSAEVVINAAALKQVPTCEYFPEQAVLTNAVGPANVVRAIQENDYPVETVIGVSTDKACKPVNVMGMTKAIQERIFTAANILAPGTRFMIVRYGNVMASRGSVIPLFQEQIRHGGPVTITSLDMTRFLMSLDDAVDVIMAAWADGLRGETYIPIAPSSTVIDLARALIGNRDIDIVVTGIRPGEKLHEILVSEEEMPRVVRRGRFLAIAPMLPELRDEQPTPSTVLAREYSSADSVIGREETAALLARTGVLGATEDRVYVRTPG